MRYYRELTEIYPRETLESSNYYIARGLVTHEFIERVRMSNSPIENLADHYEPGKEHLFLISKKEGVMMSDYPDERITNQKFLENAHGDILNLGEITNNDLNDPTNNKEYCIRPIYGGKCWFELLKFRIYKI